MVTGKRQVKYLWPKSITYFFLAFNVWLGFDVRLPNTVTGLLILWQWSWCGKNVTFVSMTLCSGFLLIYCTHTFSTICIYISTDTCFLLRGLTCIYTTYITHSYFRIFLHKRISISTFFLSRLFGHSKETKTKLIFQMLWSLFEIIQFIHLIKHLCTPWNDWAKNNKCNP